MINEANFSIDMSAYAVTNCEQLGLGRCMHLISLRDFMEAFNGFERSLESL